MPKQWVGSLAARFEIGAPSPPVWEILAPPLVKLISHISIFVDIWPRAADHEIQRHQ